MLLGAWGKAGSIGSGTAGGAPMNPTTPVVPTSGEPFPSLQRRRTRLRYIVLIVTFALYLILGASTFSSIEAPAIEAISSNVLQLREKFLGRHPHLKGECDWTVVGVRGRGRWCYSIMFIISVIIEADSIILFVWMQKRLVSFLEINFARTMFPISTPHFGAVFSFLFLLSQFVELF